ncbi:MAG: protein translocase subunit SecF [Candidatus Andersenbacteria bacterium]|nr:protein translocase subunit SecF [Candidatus Andersenbacteria bacterium]
MDKASQPNIYRYFNPRLWWHVSWVIIVVCLLVIVIIKPRWGIDFTGGSLLEIPGSPEQAAAVEVILRDEMKLTVTVQTTQEKTLLVRTNTLSQDEFVAVKQRLQGANLLPGEVLRFESIGPTIGAELRQKSWLALLLTLGLIIAYLAYTFRGARGLMASWKFGVAAIYALLHDLAFVTAVFVVLGKWKGIEIDTLFVTAQLAIFGYSTNDTIIIFDRLRSEWVATRGQDLRALLSKAIGDTLMRSLNTSLTILVVLLALLFFGGASIRWFILAMTIGTVVGTYSSIFVAAPCLYYLSRGKKTWR